MSATFPAIGHVALTVRDLETSVPWYAELFDGEPVLDEDTGPFRHVVWLVGGTLFGLHQFPDAETADLLVVAEGQVNRERGITLKKIIRMAQGDRDEALHVRRTAAEQLAAAHRAVQRVA